MKRFRIISDNGTLVVRDSNLLYKESSDMSKDSSNRNYLWLITQEDRFNFDIGIINQFTNTRLKSHYKRINGYFGIKIDSGKLILSTEDEWKNNLNKQEVILDSSIYRASIFTYEFGEYIDTRKELVNKIGENNMKYDEFVDKVGLFAWGITIISIVSLFTDIGQEYWFIPFVCWFLSWYLFSRLLKTDRYQKIDRIRIKYENRFPQYIIQLEPDNVNIPGGVQYLYD